MAAKPRFDCVVLGDANVDLLLEGETSLEEGKEKLATRMDLLLGGSSAITAVNLASMGSRVAFAGLIGSDVYGTLVASELSAAGVNLEGLQKTEQEKTGLTVWYTRAGTRAGVTYPGTIATVRAPSVSMSLLSESRHLHIGAYFLLTGLHNEAVALFQRAQALGLTTSLDCNYDPAERWDSGIRELLRHTDIFLPNEDEAQRLTGAATAQEAALALAALARVVAVKTGAAGAVVAAPDGTFTVPAQPVKVVDTTGAGDSFNAGFLHAFLGGADWQRSAEAGVAAGTLCVSQPGGTAAFLRPK